MWRMELWAEVFSYRRQEGVGCGKEEWKSTDAIEQVERHAMNGRRRQGRGTDWPRWVCLGVECPDQGERIGNIGGVRPARECGAAHNSMAPHGQVW